MNRILVVEDDEALRTGLARDLAAEGYEVLTEARGDSVLRVVLEQLPDLILLDVMLPGLDGFEVCRELRRHGIEVPIIMLTAKGAEADRVDGLEIGADDYVTKPFGLRELEARIVVQLRHQARRAAPTPARYRFGSVEIDFVGHTVRRGGTPVALTPKEFALLAFMVRHLGELLSRERLLREIFEYEKGVTTRTLDTHILRLRQKFEDDPARPQHILSVYRGGYKFVDEPGIC
jgi:two-component system alkaline phosphatase synthesis response regulator PhoP